MIPRSTAERAAERLREIRRTTGEYHATYAFGSEAIARAAYEQIRRRTKGVSAWRYKTRERHLPTWYVTVLGEEKHLDDVHRADRIMAGAGGSAHDPGRDVLDALRNRRFSGSLRAALGARQPDHVHYGAGAVLRPDGGMEPAERPQG